VGEASQPVTLVSTGFQRWKPILCRSEDSDFLPVNGMAGMLSANVISRKINNGLYNGHNSSSERATAFCFLHQ